jgi:N-acetylglucosaminyldiphosphoundecaprenol N-acetyl-beta-D-mannosaminyltransferase
MLGATKFTLSSTAIPQSSHEQEHSISAEAAAPEHFSVLGVRVHAVQIQDVMERMASWITRREMGRYIAVTGMHGIIKAQHHADFRRVLGDADLVVPDGMPLVHIGRLRGHALKRRVYGPELMLRFCQASAASGYRHFLYGGEAGVPEQLAQSLKKSCNNVCIVGMDSPPFGPVTPEEDAAMIEIINKAAPDVLWVGLSTPKQERWMHQHRDLLRVPVMVGVGAAFDFLSARKKQAPCWMREHGLEWLFRLLQEPKRLWKRYLIEGFQFLILIALDLFGWRRFD